MLVGWEINVWKVSGNAYYNICFKVNCLHPLQSRVYICIQTRFLVIWLLTELCHIVCLCCGVRVKHTGGVYVYVLCGIAGSTSPTVDVSAGCRYPARITEIDDKDKTVLVHFDGWNQRYDEWVKMDSERLRPVTRHSERKEKAKAAFGRSVSTRHIDWKLL